MRDYVIYSTDIAAEVEALPFGLIAEPRFHPDGTRKLSRKIALEPFSDGERSALEALGAQVVTEAELFGGDGIIETQGWNPKMRWDQ